MTTLVRHIDLKTLIEERDALVACLRDLLQSHDRCCPNCPDDECSSPAINVARVLVASAELNQRTT